MSIVRGNDASLAAAAVRVLAAMIHSRHIEPELLDVAGGPPWGPLGSPVFRIWTVRIDSVQECAEMNLFGPWARVE